MTDQITKETADQAEGLHIAIVLETGSGGAVLDLPGGPVTAPVLGLSPARLTPGDVVVVMFQGGDPAKPMVLGALADGALPVILADEATTVRRSLEEVVVSHPAKLVLRCGRAAITLTADGRVNLDGETITSTASGINRVAGAQVKLN